MKGGSLKEFDRLADRIRLNRQVDKRPVVIVEGPSDERLLARSFGAKASYFSAGSRDTALEEARILHNWQQDYFTCVVDRDFDDKVHEFEGEGIAIHAYGNADLESMLSVSGVAASLIAELGSTDKIEIKGGIVNIVDHLYRLVEPMTRLRRANVENSWGLAFDGVDLRTKIDKRTLEFKLQGYCAALSDTSEGSPGQKTLLQYASGQLALEKVPTCPRGSTPYFRGRDFLAFLSVALCGYCGTRRAQSVEPEILEASLRLGGSPHIRDGAWGQELLAIVESLSAEQIRSR
ncbi:hypothetical protein KQY30_18940 [Streptomyces sp. GMY02]|uniref:hypothetical protein n=1 Tax=Streptomyces sp. GMY02 TaxID=1333528 RepID=UPI001C2BA018|nr:hypothetical protein [Streptomyces sp. GMY02]QXE36021.1 hypothetical protein KQY30_18940 [Streptomyces sp. GMY02]